MRIENSQAGLEMLRNLLTDYAEYLSFREKQPLAAETVSLVIEWVDGNINELSAEMSEKPKKKKKNKKGKNK